MREIKLKLKKCKCYMHKFYYNCFNCNIKRDFLYILKIYYPDKIDLYYKALYSKDINGDSFKRSDLLFITEGIIEALMLPNAIALLGVNLFRKAIEFVNRFEFKREEVLFVVDNEIKNKEVNKIRKEIKNVGLFTTTFVYHDVKDLNEMKQNGASVMSLLKYIKNNVRM